MSITVKKAYKPHAKDSGKEVHIGDGEKGVAHSYLGVDLVVAKTKTPEN